MHVLVAILKKVRVCYRLFWLQYASLTGHSGQSVHVLNPVRRERVCLINTKLERLCISNRKKTREHYSVTGYISVHISITAHALELIHIVEQTEEHAAITEKKKKAVIHGGRGSNITIPLRVRKRVSSARKNTKTNRNSQQGIYVGSKGPNEISQRSQLLTLNSNM